MLQQILIYNLWFDPTGGRTHTIYRTRENRATCIHYTTDAVHRTEEIKYRNEQQMHLILCLFRE